MTDENQSIDEAESQVQQAAPTTPASASPDQIYLQELFKKANAGRVDPEQKILIELLAASEEGISQAGQEGNLLDRQIHELQQKFQQIKEAVNNERGKARGLAEALFALRDRKAKPVKKKKTRKTKASRKPPTV